MLVALTHYVKSRPIGNATVDTTLGDQKVLAGDFKGRARTFAASTVPIDVAKPPMAPLTIRANGGEVFYSLVLRFRRDVAHQKPYEHEDDGAARVPRPGDRRADRSPEGVKVGGMVRVRVTVSSPETRNHLAIDDPFPAGLEPLNTKLATSGGVPKKERAGGASRATWTSGGGRASARCATTASLVSSTTSIRGPRRSTTWRARRPPGRSSSRADGRGDVPARDRGAHGRRATFVVRE